ncbi:MAG: LPS assembly protein LptD [Cellvibrionales bacterium]|nr:LPS assembly protein LptD [Cellvibrionales bacterium]
MSVRVFSATESPLCPKPLNDNPIQLTQDPKQLHKAMATANNDAQHLDWVDDKNSLSACKGYYQEPANPSNQQNAKKESSETFLSADQVSSLDDNTLLLEGDVEAYKGSIRFSCQRMQYNQQTRDATIDGGFILRQPGFLLTAADGSLSNNFENLKVNKANFLMHSNAIRGKAKQLDLKKSAQKEKLLLHSSEITSCPPDSDNWTLSASTIDLDNQSGWGSAYNAVIRIEDVPVFYFPYINFPINDERKSGFLFPSLSVSSSNVDFTLPYYLNIAPNADMTYSPRLQTEHALGHGLEARYLNRFSEWQLNGQYIPSDKKVGDQTFTNKNHQDRWAYGIKEKGQLSPFISTFINYQRVSDNDYFQDWGGKGLDIEKTLNIRREAYVGFNRHQLQLDLRLIDYQTLEDFPDPLTLYRQMPRIDITYIPDVKPFKFESGFNGQFVNFEHKENRVEADRFYLEPNLTRKDIWPFAEVVSTLAYKRTDMLLKDNGDTSNVYQTTGHQHISVPVASIDAQLIFEKQHKTLYQTLTPRLFYYYAHYDEQGHLPIFDTSEYTFSYAQLFRGERFNGVDRIGDANQLTLNLSSEWANLRTGHILANVGLGQILYFTDRKVAASEFHKEHLAITPDLSKDETEFRQAYNDEVDRRFYNHTSDMAFQANFYPTPKQQIRFASLFNPFEDSFNEGSIYYQYRESPWQLINLGFRYVQNPIQPIPKHDGGTTYLKDDINMVDFSTIWPISTQWSGIIRYQYDINRNEQADRIIGLAYDNCCLNVLMAYQRERKTFDIFEWERNNYRADYKDHYMLEFTLKGLGTINSTISKLFEESIPGFRR